MRLPVLTFEAHRDVGECSKEEIQSWGAIVSEYTSEDCSEDWPPADYWSLWAEEEREESVRPASEKALWAKFGTARDHRRSQQNSRAALGRGRYRGRPA